MKTFVTLAATAALIAGVSLANAQNAPSTGMKPSPGAAQRDTSGTANKVTGNAKFCIEQGIGGGLNCKFASMEACQKEAAANNYQCRANPNLGTTGAE